jgi:hypothetical protein
VDEAKSAMNTTPDTYSGVAVDAMAKVDSARSVREPSRMPASTPTTSAIGTITIRTHSINMPVAPSRAPITSDTGARKRVELPQ